MRVVAVALVALASAWPQRRSVRVLVAALGGGVIVHACWRASFEGRSNGWAIPLVVVLAVGVRWAAVAVHEASSTPAAPWLLVAGGAAAVYGCVPETGQMWEVGLLVACGLVAELVTWRQLPVPVLAAAGALVLWSAVFGATGRPRALVGGMFAVVPLVATAVVVRPRRGRVVVRDPWLWAVGTVWVVAALVVARTGGIARTLRPAVLAVAVAAPVAAALSAAVWRRARRSRCAG